MILSHIGLEEPRRVDGMGVMVKAFPFLEIVDLSTQASINPFIQLV